MFNYLKNLAGIALVALPLGMLIMGAPDAKTGRDAITMLTIGERDIAPWSASAPASPAPHDIHFTLIDAEPPRYDLSPPPIASEGFAGTSATPEALAFASAEWPEAASGDIDPISPGLLVFAFAVAAGLGLLLESRPRRPALPAYQAI
ncbi:hypothetical protein [Sphingomonas sp. KC8]|uniref:hypothetical protein n=1 Tax=Sphingomonas sp. KC8 TaxID=1030157 RepID=UPI00024897D6|nr:hypothetical protein [Sphingomonas sp. KC8]